MKKVVLLFPDISSMADFIMNEKVGNAEANTFEQTLIAIVTDKEIVTAQRIYGAIIKASIKTNEIAGPKSARDFLSHQGN